jgi:capsid protein
VVGYWVTVPSGRLNAENSGVMRFLPAAECCLYANEELVGVEAPLPRDVSITKALHNISAFHDEILSTARNHAKAPITITPPEGQHAADWARGIATGTETNETPVRYTLDAAGIEALVLEPGETAERHVANLPTPLDPFLTAHMRMAAAGGDTSYARIARVPDGSYSAGRQTEQNDNPQIEIDRAAFIGSFGRFVWCKFIEACWAFELIDLPDYLANRVAYHTFRWTPPAVEALNPIDKLNYVRGAIEGGLLSLQDGIEMLFGNSFTETLEERADAIVEAREMEAAKGLEDGELTPLTQTGQSLTAPEPPDPPPETVADPTTPKTEAAPAD